MSVFSKLSALILSVFMATFSPNPSFATAETVVTAWQGEFEAFIPWYAKKMGWDKEEGIKLSVLRFDSGKSIAENLENFNWAIAGLGMKPALTSKHSNKMQVIGIANDESKANFIFVRPNCSILSAPNKSPYQNIYGSKETIQEKTIIYTKNSSAEYLLDMWLAQYDLSRDKVKTIDLAPKVTLGAFNSNMGNVLVTWTPYAYEALSKGYKVAGTADELGIKQYVLLVANKDFTRQQPHNAEAFMKLYFRGINWIKNTNIDIVAKEYMQFNKEWVKQDIDFETAKNDILLHPIFTAQEQISLFNKNAQQNIQTVLHNMIKHYEKLGEINKNDLERLKKHEYINDYYINKLAK